MRTPSHGEGGAAAVGTVVFDDGNAAIAASSSGVAAAVAIVVGLPTSASVADASCGSCSCSSSGFVAGKLFRGDEFLGGRAARRAFVGEQRILAVVEGGGGGGVAVAENARGGVGGGCGDVAGTGVADDGLGAPAASAVVGVFHFACHGVDHSYS